MGLEYLPALLTSASMRPNFDLTCSKAFSIDESSSMSIWIGSTVDFVSLISDLRVEIASLALSRERLPIRIVWASGEA